MEESINDALVSTQRNCKEILNKIKNIQKTLLENSKDIDSRPSSTTDILNAKLCKLKVELSIEEEGSFQPPLYHPLAVSTLLLKELEEVSTQMEQIMTVLKVRCAALHKNLEEKENLILEQSELNEALMLHLQHEPKPLDETEKEKFAVSYQKELTAKRKLCETKRRDLQKKMNLFLKKHFPLPQTSSSLNESFSLNRLIPFNHFVDDLITKKMNDPEDPYLVLGSQHWPPYVETLLSYGLVARHPSNINKIKLHDLHL